MKNFNYYNGKIGMPPGTIIYTGEKNDFDIKLELYSFNNKILDKKKLNHLDDFSFIKNNNRFNWLNVKGIHNIDFIKKVGELFNIDNLILEDLTNVSQMVKIENRDSYLFIVLKNVCIKNEKINYQQVSFLLIGNNLITFQEDDEEIFHSIKNRIEIVDSKIRKKDIKYLTYAIIDSLVDNYFSIIDFFDKKSDELEYNILKNFKEEYLEEILNFKEETSIFKKVTYSMKEINLKFFTGELSVFFGKELKNYFRDLYDHINSISYSGETINSKSLELLQIYYTSVSNNINSVMKVLTIISTIFIPLSFLTGLYGMNFKYMPELENPYGYFYTLGVMLLIIILMGIYFKKKKWW